MSEYTRVQNELEEARNALYRAADIIGATTEYTDSASIFHAEAVSRYNSIITAALHINHAQR